MKTGISTLISIVFCCILTLPAMIIHNDLKKDKDGIRSESGNFNEDYLFLGRDLQFSGQVEDLVFLGKKLTFSGKAKFGVIGLCQYVFFSGEAGNGIMVACMDIDITGKIAGNNYVACKSLQISETSVIQGNLLAACADLEINGTLNGNLYTAAHEVVINNEIRGNVTAYAQRIYIGEKGRINGSLTYTGQKELSEAERSRVTGTVTRDKKKQTVQKRVSSRRATGFLIGAALIVSYVIMGILLLFLPAFRKLNEPQSERSFWHTALWGLLPLLMYPAVVALCFVLVITIPFGITLMMAFVPLMYLAWVIGAVLIGKYLAIRFNWHMQKLHYQFLIGALVLVILSMLPYVNILSVIFVTALGWGVYVSFLFKKEM